MTFSFLRNPSRLMIVVAVAGGAWASTITYNVNLSIGTNAAVSGTIVTDGTLGTLALGNVVGWNLTITDGTNNLAVNLTQANSGIFGSATDLNATSTQLTYDFSDPSEGELYIENGSGFVCLGPSQGACADGSLGNVIGIEDNGQEQATTYTGTNVVATVSAVTAPEPSPLIFVIAGAPSVLLLLRKARRQNAG